MSTKIRDRHSRKDSSVAGTEKTGGYESPVIVAGIGVGAGGAKSLKQLLGKIPSRMGIAYVLVMHPGPSKKILSVRQLRNLTTLDVVEATEGMQVLADRIHVMPSDKFLNITGGRLTLHRPVQCDGMWMPIDHFLCTLAHDFRRRSCGIVLSGAGSDGTLGLSEIKAFGGRAFVEKPGAAEFPEMPQSAIDAGVADGVFAAGAMAEALAAAAEQAQEEIRKTPANSQETNADLQDILKILRSKIGYDFRGYKPNTLVRRIRRRMALGKFASYADYTMFLQEHPEEVALLQKDLLIGVTEFFRQPQAWEILQEKSIASIVENAQPGSEIRVWVPGCSTGQEAYSLAMVLTEQVKNSGKKVGIQIFATDSDFSALAAARSGSYSKDEIGQTVTAERLKRFFERKDGRYQILKSIREQIVFAPQNLTADPPFSRLDLISCRNLLMYLEQPVQQKIIVLFHFALRAGGFLFLGTAETTGDREDLFDPVSKKWRIYRRIGIGHPAGIEIPVHPADQTQPPAGASPAVLVPRLTLASAAQQMLLDRFAPACVMIDRKLQVLYVHGKVEDYLTFPTGELTTRIVDMAREGLRARLRGAIGKCLEMKRPVSVIARVRRGEKSVPVKATVSPLRHPRETDGLLLVTFEDHRLPVLMSGQRAARESDVQQLSDELKVTREELQSTIEQLESSNDQLKASNEEVTASNEELQSANEELETSKEELQSLNEELNTINARLQEKVGELEGTNNDVLNLLSSTAIATVFLDRELRVKRFTPASTRLLSLIPSDLGRPVADVLLRFADEMLLEDARRVLKELTPIAKEVQAEDGRWYFRRITPYRTQDDRIEGVVFTFVDVSDIKQAEQALRASEKKYRDLVESANSIIIRWKPDGEIAYVNRYALSFFGYREEEILGRNAMILVPGQDSSGQDLTGLTTAIVEHPEQYVSNENENVLADGRRVWVQWANKAILDEAGNIREILAIGNDITDRKRAEQALSESRNRLSVIVDSIADGFFAFDRELHFTLVNDAALSHFRKTREEMLGRTLFEVFPKARGTLFETEYRRAMESGEPVHFESPSVVSDKAMEMHAYPGRETLTVLFRDVTERHRMVEDLHAAHEKVSWLARFPEENPSPVLRVSVEGEVLYCNPAAMELGEWKCEIGQTVTGPVMPLVRQAMAEGREVMQDVDMGDRTYSVAVTPFSEEGYANVYGRDITERKRAEEILQNTLQRFYNVLSGMYAAVLLVKDDGLVEFANQAFCDLYSLKESPVSLNGLTSKEIIERIKNAYQQPDEAVARIQEIVRVGQPVKGEEVAMSGGRTCLRDFIPIIVNGISYGRLWHHLDITDRKRAEEALRKAKDELEERVKERTYELYAESLYARSLIEASLDPLVTISVEGKITDVNHASEEVTGVSREQLIGSDFSDYFTEPEKARAAYEEVFRQGFIRDYPLELKRRDGRVTPVLYNASVYRDETGRIMGVFAAARDITVSKKAEESVKAERQRLYDVLETLPVYAILLTPDYHVSFANRFFRERFGEDRGRRCYEYLFHRTEPCEICETYTVQKTGKPHHWEWLGPDGKNYDIYDFPFTDSDGSPLIMEVGIDITMRKQAETALRKLASELVMAEERERKRVARVLHDDIAQILAAARMRLDLLQSIPPDQHDQQTLKDAKALLVQSIQETRALMNDLGNPLLFDMGLRSACEALAERLMESHPVRIHCEIRDDYKHLDPEMKTILYQVIRELMNNVVKHSEARNAHVLVNMENGRFLVKVTDDGVGFDPETLGVPSTEGGFGLYSIRERLIAIDGSLSIESNPGTGTVVTAVLPATLDS